MNKKKDCFAYNEKSGECKALTATECEECTFYKKKGTECDTCTHKGKVSCQKCRK